MIVLEKSLNVKGLKCPHKNHVIKQIIPIPPPFYLLESIWVGPAKRGTTKMLSMNLEPLRASPIEFFLPNPINPSVGTTSKIQTACPRLLLSWLGALRSVCECVFESLVEAKEKGENPKCSN